MPETLDGQFILGEPLGVGTVGSVYVARWSKTNEPIAVKVLLPSVSGDQNISARFNREMLILEKLDHPNIVRYYGGGRSGGQLFYGMELVDGGSIKQLIHDNGLLPWRMAVRYAIQIASALQHAHNHGIIHRDLKPGNLFLDREDNIKLGDFGIALDTHASDLTADGITVGTYAYMSPEQIRADGKVTGQSDLYSLGCVLYEMLTGEPPFPGDNFAKVWDQHLSAKRPRPSENGADCPDWLDDLVVQLLQIDPQDRPFNARQVQGILLQSSDIDPHSRNIMGDVGSGSVVDGPQAVAAPVVGWIVLTLLASTVGIGLWLVVRAG